MSASLAATPVPISLPTGRAARRSFPAPTRYRLHAEAHGPLLEPLSEALHSRVLGQDDAVVPLVGAFSRALAGLRDPARPLVSALLLGPTGVGKTETAKGIAESLFGTPTGLIKIHCEEYAQGHEVAKLLGSPPGYVGHQIEPLLSQSRLSRAHRRALNQEDEGSTLLERLGAPDEERFVSVILFDEIEKAHPSLWSALLGLLEEGEVTLGDNSTTLFRDAIVLMTSNVGSGELSELLDRRPVGFQAKRSPCEAAERGARDDEDAAADRELLRRTALAAARESFPHEFLNRFDEVLAYSSLDDAALRDILGKFLGEIHERAIAAEVPFLLQLAPEAEDWLVETGTDLRFGARPLRRAVERELIDPLSRLIASDQVRAGDVIEAERLPLSGGPESPGEGLIFYRSNRLARRIVV